LHWIAVTPFPKKEVQLQLGVLRGGVRIAMSTIRKLEKHQAVDSNAVLHKLARVRAEATDLLDAVRIK
jgi:hypothetical protein